MLRLQWLRSFRLNGITKSCFQQGLCAKSLACRTPHNGFTPQCVVSIDYIEQWSDARSSDGTTTQNSTGCADPYLQAHGSVFANTDQYFLFRLCTKFWVAIIAKSCLYLVLLACAFKYKPAVFCDELCLFITDQSFWCTLLHQIC